MKVFSCLYIFLIGALFISCQSKPKVIEAEGAGKETDGSAVFSDAPVQEGGAGVGANDISQQAHQVTVLEVLNTTKYTYLRVKEKAEEYWIAIAKREVKIGGVYFHRGGLLKKNFHSEEFNRDFETVYLVSDFQDAVQSGGGSPAEHMHPAAQAEVTAPIQHAPGAITLKQLIEQKEKYANKTVKVTGKCVKVNPMIMQRNWVHLQDGSGKKLDLTVTTTEQVALGEVVTLEGVLSLKKDFGAGYQYDYILENAKKVK